MMIFESNSEAQIEVQVAIAAVQGSVSLISLFLSTIPRGAITCGSTYNFLSGHHDADDFDFC